MKIIFSGPECSGKSTLSTWLAKELNGYVCTEYAREYLSKKQSKYSFHEIEVIGRKQKEKWVQKKNESILIMDTDFLVLKIWSNWKFKACSKFIEQEWENQKFDFYFLCKPDIPWEYDKLRESKNERIKLYREYVLELNKKNISYTILEGSLENRKQKIKAVLDNKLLSH